MDNQIILEDCRRIIDKAGLDALAGKSLLITGATGLLGTYFLYSVKTYNDSSPVPIHVTIVCHRQLPEHLACLTKESWLKVLQGDLSDDVFLSALPHFDAVIHAATYGQPGRFLEEQVKTLTLNTVVTKKLLSLVEPQGYFLFISSSEIYSGSEETPYMESTHGVTMPDHPRACYIEGKRCGEAFCQCYARQEGIHARIARVALSYGPGVRADDRRVLYNFIQKALDGRIEMLDRGEARRVYCYVADTVEMLWNIMLTGKETVYNVGNLPASETSIYEMARTIGAYLHVPVIRPQTDLGGLNKAPSAVQLDMSRYVQEFSKTDFVSLEEGLARTIDWYRQCFPSAS